MLSYLVVYHTLSYHFTLHQSFYAQFPTCHMLSPWRTVPERSALAVSKGVGPPGRLALCPRTWAQVLLAGWNSMGTPDLNCWLSCWAPLIEQLTELLAKLLAKLLDKLLATLVDKLLDTSRNEYTMDLMMDDT